MTRAPLAAATLAVVALAAAAAAQDPDAVYQQQNKQPFRFAGDSLARYEWTRGIPTAAGKINTDRYRVQARPRVEATIGPVELGVGGEFNYSDDENDIAPRARRSRSSATTTARATRGWTSPTRRSRSARSPPRAAASSCRSRSPR